LDIIFGSFATLVAAILTYLLKEIKFKKIPILAFAPPILVNAFIIGLEIAIFFLPEGFSIYGFLISGLQVGIGQTIVCYGLGIPFYLTVSKYNLLKKTNK
jgi:uncharacterized membrane protein